MAEATPKVVKLSPRARKLAEFEAFIELKRLYSHRGPPDGGPNKSSAQGFNAQKGVYYA